MAGAEHAHAAHRVIARQQHHLHALVLGGVEREQLAHQRKRHARRSRHVEPLALQVHVGAVIVLLEDAVLFLKIEQRARGDRDHQLVVERYSHKVISRTG